MGAAIEGLDSEDVSLVELYEEIEALAQYDVDLPGKPGEYVHKITGVSELVHGYVSETASACTGRDGEVELDSVLGQLEGRGADISYTERTGFTGALKGLLDDFVGAKDFVYGDEGLCLAANTIGLNWEMHGREDEESQLWAEVEELEDAYRIGIWDDGPGLPDGYDGENIFKKGNGENTGLGLYLAREITELFDGSLEYSEEYASREDGFGLEWTLMKPDQYSTSESL
ncbi:MAG: ATP-binding protein [Candidatus Nanohaloarchaea archaeon]